MRKSDALKDLLTRIDGKGYKAYKNLEGVYDYGDFSLWIDHVQGDPFAAPSRLRVQVEQKKAKFSPALYHPRIRAIALQDFLTRQFDKAIRALVKGVRGIGGSGRIAIDCPGQEVLERTSCTVDAEKVEARFTAGLPAAGRRVLGRQAADMLFREIPELVRHALLSANLPANELWRHVQVIEDQETIRGSWKEINGSVSSPMVPCFPEEAASMIAPWARMKATPPGQSSRFNLLKNSKRRSKRAIKDESGEWPFRKG
jgi:predicted ABC-class ATPase